MKSIFNKIILRAMVMLPRGLVYQFAGRYVAGENFETALNVTRELNDQGYSVTLDILGEHTKSREKAVGITNEYANIYNLINKQKLDCNISLKPTHIGLDISQNY